MVPFDAAHFLHLKELGNFFRTKLIVIGSFFQSCFKIYCTVYVPFDSKLIPVAGVVNPIAVSIRHDVNSLFMMMPMQASQDILTDFVTR